MNKIQAHESICRDLNELYARKNIDYGDSFGKSFEEYGLTMVCIRLEDKLNRIKSLSKQAARVSDESITDTLMDLANYSIMTLVEMARRGNSHSDRGEHLDGCNPECQCMTCVHDNGNRSPACCTDHGFDRCIVTECHNYEKEV